MSYPRIFVISLSSKQIKGKALFLHCSNGSCHTIVVVVDATIFPVMEVSSLPSGKWRVNGFPPIPEHWKIHQNQRRRIFPLAKIHQISHMQFVFNADLSNVESLLLTVSVYW